MVQAGQYKFLELRDNLPKLLNQSSHVTVGANSTSDATQA
jgi:hypothetical protein